MRPTSTRSRQAQAVRDDETLSLGVATSVGLVLALGLHELGG